MSLTKEMARLILLQIAGFAALFSGVSSRIAAGVALLQRLASPDVWEAVWGLVGPNGTATAPGGASAAINADRLHVQPAHADPFGWLDEVASAREEWKGEDSEQGQRPADVPGQPQVKAKKG